MSEIRERTSLAVRAQRYQPPLAPPSKGSDNAGKTAATATKSKGGATKPKDRVSTALVEPRQLSQGERAWAAKLAAAQPYAAVRLFHKAYDPSHDNFAGVLGKLSPAATATLFGKDKRELLAKACVHAFVQRVALKVKAGSAEIKGRIDALMQSAGKRSALWSKLGTPQKRERFLVSLGMSPARAKALAKSSEVPHKRLAAALGQTKKRVVAAQDKLEYRLRNAIAHPADALALFQTLGPAVRAARTSLGIRKGSFADKALAAHASQGKVDKKRFTAYKALAGLAASLITGGIFSGVAISAAGVFAAGAAGSAGAAAIMGAPPLIAQSGQRELARITEQMKLADPGTLAKAKKAYAKALRSYLVGVLGSAAAGGGAGLLGKVGAGRIVNATRGLLTKIKVPAVLVDKIAYALLGDGIKMTASAVLDFYSAALSDIVGEFMAKGVKGLTVAAHKYLVAK